MWTVGILVFDDVEILDFSGPYEVFSTAARVHARISTTASLFRCFLVAPAMRPVYARAGMKVLPDCVLTPASDIDVLIVPGGDVSKVMHEQNVIDWIRAQAGGAELIASVCTGSFLLGKAGLLDGLNVTTHWEDQAEMAALFPETMVRQDVPWIDCGKVVTSGGISAGIDMSLHLVERLVGRQLAEATARQMEYRWSTHGIDIPDASHSRLFSAA